MQTPMIKCLRNIRLSRRFHIIGPVTKQESALTIKNTNSGLICAWLWEEIDGSLVRTKCCEEYFDLRKSGI
jgi:hypothetical protein